MLLTARSLNKMRPWEVLNRKPVSTNPDECRDVRLEISTNLKRKAVNKTEDIVSANGDIGLTCVEHIMVLI